MSEVTTKKHEHSIYDTDPHFKIDPVTMAITTEAKKTTLIKGSHNCERFTFEMPKEIEGHDMSECDKVEIHYLNIGSGTDRVEDIHEVDDFQANPVSGSDVMIFSWLLDGNACKYAGSLSFAIVFKCTDGDVTTYSKPTDKFSGITVKDTINNGEAVIEERSDILQQWYDKLFGVGQIVDELEATKAETIEAIQRKTNECLNSIPETYSDMDATVKQHTDKLLALENGGTTGGSNDANGDIKKLNDEIFVVCGGDSVATSRVRGSYALDGQGNMVSDSSSNIYVYGVKAGDVLWLSVSKDNAGVFQFGTSDYPLSSGVIGTIVNDSFEGSIVVPDGATHLFVSQLSTNTTNVVSYSLTKSKIDEIKKQLDDNTNQISETTEILYKVGDLLEVSNIRKGYSINEQGNTIDDSNSQQVIYSVSAGDKLFVNLSKDNDVVYQWSTVDIANINKSVGTPVKESTNGIITVPEGALYLVISQFVNNKTNYVGYVSNISEKREATHIRVGTYNIGHFIEGVSQHSAGTEENKVKFRNTIAKLGCSILGIQENNPLYNETTGESSRDAVYANFKYYSTSSQHIYVCNGIASDYKLYNLKKTTFKNQTNTSERSYYEANIIIDDKIIHLICTHLDWSNTDIRREQINELIARANQFERVIIMGDFNPNNPDDPYAPDVFQTDYAKWTDAGYKLANNGYFGVLNTIADKEGTEEASPWDNIIVSPNIYIKAVGTVYDDSYMTDHIPVWADLVVY